MAGRLVLDPDRFFPAEPAVRAVARRLFARTEALPVVSPHGHADPAWFARNEPFEDAVSIFIWPDHYVQRLLYSQGVSLEALGISGKSGPAKTDRREIWRSFAEQYDAFLGTPTRIWLDHAFANVFGLSVKLSASTADTYFDAIGEALATEAFRPRALFERFNIEVLATTEGALDALPDHKAIRSSGWKGRVLSTFRPDDVIDPQRETFAADLERLSALTNEATDTWEGYLTALGARRKYFREIGGATATDHGHPTAQTADLPPGERRALFQKVSKGGASPEDAELFRAQMLTEMAAMACEDGMTMQLHAGVWRNHNVRLFENFGRDRGGDVPVRGGFVRELKPLLDRFGNRTDLRLILFTLDESLYSRELAPLAGHYPCLKLGPPWWFHDSSEGMLRYRRQTTETAGFYNTVGFNDDTRSFFSLTARHDLARRMDASYLAELVATHRLDIDDAEKIAVDLAYNLPKAAYRL